MRSSYLLSPLWLIAIGASWWECQAAKLIQDLSFAHSIECDLCKCTDRFWPNCTFVCQKTIQDSQTQYPLSALNTVLLDISPSCQVYADVTLSQSLDPEEWCQSTTSGRDGYVLQNPSTSLDGYNLVRGHLRDRFVNITGSNFACSALANDEGYITYPSIFAPSPSFCPISASPSGRALADISVSSNGVLTIPMNLSVRPDTIANAIRHELHGSKYYNADSFQPYTLRLMKTQSGDTDCYGDIKQINITRRITGFFNGRNYDSFGATALDEDDLVNCTRQYSPVLTNDQIVRPNASAIWQEDTARNAPGFDFIQW